MASFLRRLQYPQLSDSCSSSFFGGPRCIWYNLGQSKQSDIWGIYTTFHIAPTQNTSHSLQFTNANYWDGDITHIVLSSYRLTVGAEITSLLSMPLYPSSLGRCHLLSNNIELTFLRRLLPPDLWRVHLTTPLMAHTVYLLSLYINTIPTTLCIHACFQWLGQMLWLVSCHNSNTAFHCTHMGNK